MKTPNEIYWNFAKEVEDRYFKGESFLDAYIKTVESHGLIMRRGK